MLTISTSENSLKKYMNIINKAYSEPFPILKNYNMATIIIYNALEDEAISFRVHTKSSRPVYLV